MNSNEFYEVLERLGDTPNQIKYFVEKMSADAVRIRPSLEEFSVLEHICHLRDIEGEGYRDRIRSLLDGGAPFLVDIDGDLLARERDYNNQEISDSVSAFAGYRKENILVLQNIEFEKLDNQGVLQNVGTITLGDLLLAMCEHDKEHLQMIVELALRP